MCVRFSCSLKPYIRLSKCGGSFFLLWVCCFSTNLWYLWFVYQKFPSVPKSLVCVLCFRLVHRNRFRLRSRARKAPEVAFFFQNKKVSVDKRAPRQKFRAVSIFESFVSSLSCVLRRKCSFDVLRWKVLDVLCRKVWLGVLSSSWVKISCAWHHISSSKNVVSCISVFCSLVSPQRVFFSIFCVIVSCIFQHFQFCEI